MSPFINGITQTFLRTSALKSLGTNAVTVFILRPACDSAEVSGHPITSICGGSGSDGDPVPTGAGTQAKTNRQQLSALFLPHFLQSFMAFLFQDPFIVVPGGLPHVFLFN